MGPARRLAAFLAALTLCAGAASGGPVVYLHPSAVVPPGGLALGSIAAVVSDDPAQAAALASLVVGEAPGRLCYLPLAEVRRRVARAYPAQVDLVGSGVALLPAGAVPARLEAQAAALLTALGRVDQGQGRLEVELLSGLPESAAEPVLLSRPSPGRLSGRLQIQLGEAGVLLFAHPFAEVARAARDLERGRLLHPAGGLLPDADAHPAGRAAGELAAGPQLPGQGGRPGDGGVPAPRADRDGARQGPGFGGARRDGGGFPP
jgi:hypothetical protein